eukprot:2336771-Alexandrium_andersonii.AAC.1
MSKWTCCAPTRRASGMSRLGSAGPQCRRLAVAGRAGACRRVGQSLGRRRGGGAARPTARPGGSRCGCREGA